MADTSMRRFDAPRVRRIGCIVPSLLALSLLVATLAYPRPSGASPPYLVFLPHVPTTPAFPAVVATIHLGNNDVGLRLNPIAVAADSTTNRVFVVSNNDNGVSVIDAATNTVLSTRLAVGPAPPYALGVDPLSHRLYIAVDGGMWVVDTLTNSFIGGEIVFGHINYGVGVDGALNRIYVPEQIYDHIFAVDGAADAVVATLQGGYAPYAVAVNAVTHRVYVGNAGEPTVTVIDAQSNTVVGSPITVGSVPISVAVNPRTNRVYTANTYDGTVSVIDGATNTVIGPPIAAGPNSRSVAVDETRNHIYVASGDSSTVSIIDGSTDQIDGAPIVVGGFPTSLAVNQTTGLIYVANMNSGTVSVVQDR
jgi:YVTN family beta-propeller protein